jgi:hypothetical protein
MLRPARVAGEASCVKSSDGSVAMRTNIPVRGFGSSLFQGNGGHRAELVIANRDGQVSLFPRF